MGRLFLESSFVYRKNTAQSCVYSPQCIVFVWALVNQERTHLNTQDPLTNDSVVYSGLGAHRIVSSRQRNELSLANVLAESFYSSGHT